MRTSHLAILASIVLLTAGCASRKPPALPPFEAHAASLGITRGMRLAAFAQLPDGFTPALGVAPIWLEQGREIALAGSSRGGSIILGLSGPGLTHGRVLAADFGPGAQAGRIVDAAANTDGTRLATLVAESSAPRLDLVVRGMTEGDYGEVIGSFDGIYDRAALAWLGPDLLAITLHAGPQPQTPANAPDQPATLPANGIYLVDVAKPSSLFHLEGIDCPVSRLNVAPDARLALSEGADGVAPALIDLKSHQCRPLPIATAIKPLGWARDSSALLFAAPGPGGVTGAFRYVVATGAISTVAIGSQLAAIASDGTLIVIGSRHLTWQSAAANPAASIRTQVALINSATGEIKLNELGYSTTPLWLARSSIAYSTVSDYAAIDALLPGLNGDAQRELIDYTARSHNAYVLGLGPADQPLAMSWSPGGTMLAVVTSSSSSNVLTVFIPPN
jgi:hypothetical protein